MNIRNKNIKASAARNKADYIQSANNRFGFKVEGKGTFVWTSELAEDVSSMWKAESTLSERHIKKEVKSYEMKTVGTSSFWVITELDGTVIVSDSIEYTKSYFFGKRNKKAKATDYIPPHKCFGYYTDRSCLVMEEADIKETEEIGDGGSYNRWRKDFVSLIKETFK